MVEIGVLTVQSPYRESFLLLLYDLIASLSLPQLCHTAIVVKSVSVSTSLSQGYVEGQSMFRYYCCDSIWSRQRVTERRNEVDLNTARVQSILGRIRLRRLADREDNWKGNSARGRDRCLEAADGPVKCATSPLGHWRCGRCRDYIISTGVAQPAVGDKCTAPAADVGYAFLTRLQTHRSVGARLRSSLPVNST